MRIVILGGGFCGALCARILEKKLPEAEIVLVDRKDCFEYQPSIHKVIFHPEKAEKIRIPYSKMFQRVNIITDEIVKITPKIVWTKHAKLTFDYLVVSIGIEYPILLENKKNIFVLKSADDAKELGKKIVSAKKILIIGGGLIGVELAGELVTKTTQKEITIVHPHNRLIERNPEKASRYAKNFLETRGANIIFGEKIVKHAGNRFTTDKGTIIEADVAVWCAGVRCNSSFMKGFNAEILTQKKALNVNNFLQLSGYKNIFVGGDISGVKEEKTAQNAENHVKIIAENICRLATNKQLKSYAPHSGPLIISLGDYAAILTFKGYSICCILPALLKKLTEIYIIWKYS